MWHFPNDSSQIQTMTFHDKFTALFERSGWNQRQLSATLGVGVSTINRWLNGETEPPLSQGFKIARLYGVTLDFLADETLDRPASSVLDKDEAYLLRVFHDAGLSPGVAAGAIIAAAGKHEPSTGTRKNPAVVNDVPGPSVIDQLELGGTLTPENPPAAQTVPPPAKSRRARKPR